MAKRRRQASNKFVISIDEYEQGELTLLAAVFFPEHSVNRFQREWTALQRSIRTELRRSYPFAQKPEMQEDSWLPEIHAKELYQSQKIFRNDETKYPGYWKIHRRWISEAVAIIFRARPIILSTPYRQEYVEANKKLLGLPTDTWAADVPYKNMREKMDRLFQSRYVWALTHMLDSIENLLEQKKYTAELICDEHGDGYGFSSLHIFDIAHKKAEIPRLSAPIFASSQSHALLQAADIVAYIFGSVYSNPLIRKKKPDIFNWATQLLPLDERKPSGRNVDFSRSTARIFEFLIRTSGGPKEYRERLAAQINDFVDSAADGQDIHVYLGPEGLKYGVGPQMYKPPSEDGGLSEEILPEAGMKDKNERKDSETL